MPHKKLFTAKPKLLKIFEREYSASNFIPYTGYWNDSTLITSDNRLLSIIRLNGFSFETADDSELEMRKVMRNSLFKGLSNPDIELSFHFIRKRENPYPSGYVNSAFPDGFASFLDSRWVAFFQEKDCYINELYISVVSSRAKSSKLNIFKSSLDAMNKIFRKRDIDKSTLKSLASSHDLLSEIVSHLCSGLAIYKPYILSVVENEDGQPVCEISSFLNKVLCGISKDSVPFAIDAPKRSIINNRYTFGNKTIVVDSGVDQKKYAAMISLKEYCSSTWAGILDNFLHIPVEFVMTQSFKFTNRQSMITKMQIQQNRMIQASDKALTQIAQITDALDKLSGGEIAFGNHHLSVMCFANDPNTLDVNSSIIASEFTNFGAVSVRETINMEPAFWGQLPGNLNYIVRKAPISTFNLSSFVSLHNYPVGKKAGNFWGDFVTVLDTTSDTPYYFNFHIRDVGHTIIIGPTGAGKTVLLNFLAAQAQKFHTRLFFFDKDRGAEIFIRALNGVYLIIKPGKDSGFNPLQLDDTPENRTFLMDWLKALVSSNGESISSEDTRYLISAINGNYKLNKSDRKLNNLLPFLGVDGPGTLIDRLSAWVNNGSHARVFDNDLDMLDLYSCNIFAFEMAELLKDKMSIGPVLLYLFHRINLSLTGAKTMIILDEAWALIDNPIFAPKLKDWLKVLRKLNAFVVFATQSVEDAAKSSISDTLVQQAATQIFLPNLKATNIYRDIFMLTDRELELIKTTDPGSRFFLLKQANDSVIARVDLSKMSDIVQILSGRAETVAILDDVRNKYGDDVNAWLPQFVIELQKYERH